MRLVAATHKREFQTFSQILVGSQSSSSDANHAETLFLNAPQHAVDEPD